MSSDAPLPWRATADGVRLSVRLTPKSSRDGLDGIEILSDCRAVLKVRVRAVPEAGAANDALLRVIAKHVALSNSAVTLESGATGRVKILSIAGDAEDLQRRLMHSTQS
jgi:uncharacterized protein